LSRKPHPAVSVGAKIAPKLADELYELATKEFGGNVSEAVREGIELLIAVRGKLSPELAESFYKLVNEEFEGNIGEALREGINLLVSQSPKLKGSSRRRQ